MKRKNTRRFDPRYFMEEKTEAATDLNEGTNPGGYIDRRPENPQLAKHWAEPGSDVATGGQDVARDEPPEGFTDIEVDNPEELERILHALEEVPPDIEKAKRLLRNAALDN